MSRNSSYPPPPPRTRSRQTTYDNPMMTNYAVQTEDIPRYVPHYASRPQQTHSPPTTISTVDAVVRPPSRPPSERSDYPSESIKFEENKGFFLSYWRAALIAIGVVLLLLLVGLLVGFLKPGPTPPSNVTVTGAPPTLDPSKSWNHLRLPDTMEPIEYDLHLRINVDAARFNGSVSMTVRILQDTDEVLVHAMTLDVTQSSVSVAEKDSKRNVPITNQFVFELHNYYVIELGETLKSDESYVITFGDFTGRLLPDMTGLYLSPYRMAGQERFIVASFFEPSFARKAFPCFDEPALKAVFRVNITHPRYNRETVLFNTELESTIDADTGWVTEIFKETQKMSTYLLGFALGDLQKLEVVRQGGHTIRVWSRSEVIDQMQSVLYYAEKSYEYFENYFAGINEPLEKTDFIALPTLMSLGLENWGIVNLLESYVRYDEYGSSIHRKVQLADLVAHEVAHSWFGNLVSLEWWDDIWLKEGFASFFAIEALNYIEPDWNIDDIAIVDVVQHALSKDQYFDSHALTVEGVEDMDVIMTNYDAITYYKGISVVRMLKQMVGDTAFNNGIRSYLDDYEFSSANADDLWEEFTRATGGSIQVKELMDSWILQQGYPVVDVIKSTSASGSREIQLDQSLFLIKPDDVSFDYSTSSYSYKWYLEFTSITENDDTVRTNYLEMDNLRVDMPSSYETNWILGNIGLSGFYRVNYEESNWNQLMEELQGNHQTISATNRAVLIDDALALQRAGLLDTQLALKMTLYLSEETDYTPWATASYGFKYISERLYLTDIYGRFQSYVLDLLNRNSKVDSIGWRSNDNEDLHTRYKRVLWHKMACRHGDSNCKADAMQYFQNWLDNGVEPPNDMRSVIYSTGVAESDSNTWDVLWDIIQTRPQLQDDETALRNALTRSPEPWVLNRYMSWSMNYSIISDGQYIIQQVGESPTGSSVAFDFIIEHWDSLITVHSNPWAFEAILGTVKTVNRRSQLRQFQALRSRLPPGKVWKKVFDKYVARIIINIEWLEKYESEIKRFLDENTSH